MNFNSIKVRTRYFGAGPVLVASLFALTLTATVWPLLSRLHQKYPEPVAGPITFSDLTKSVDMRSLLLLMGSTAVFTVVITAIGRAVFPPEKEADLPAVNQFLLYSLVPAGFRLATACFNDSKKLPPLLLISVFPVAAVATLLMLRRYRKDLPAADLFTVGGAVLLAPVMAGFSALGLVMAIARTVRGQADALRPYVNSFAGIVVGAAVLVVLVLWILSPTIELFRKRMLGLLMGCQYALPLLLFYVVPPPLIDDTHQFRIAYPTALVISMFLLVAVGVYRMFRRFRSKTIEIDRPLVKAVSPVSVACLMVFILSSSVWLPEPWHDFFDIGEPLVPWQQIVDFHSLPFVNFSPIHGLMEITYGALNAIFFDGTAASFECARSLFAGFGVAVTALTACELLSPVMALLFLVAPMAFSDRFYFVAASLFLVSGPRLLKKPVLWLTLWLVVGLLVSGYNPSLGPAFVLATVPVALWQTWRGFWIARLKLALLMAVSLIAAAAVWFVVPMHQIAFGFVHFVLDNAWTTEIAEGIAWSSGISLRDRYAGLGSSQFLWELARSGWIPISIGAAVVCWKQFSKPLAERSTPAIVLSLSIPLNMMIASMYIIEQIDEANLSRLGCITEVALFYLVPALLYLTISKSQRALCVLLLATFIGLMYPWFPSSAAPMVDPDAFLQKPCAIREIAPGTSCVDGPALGLPRLGQVVRENPDWTAPLVKLKKDLSTLLKPGETFFDLANQTAIYYYLDLPSPGQYCPWVAANSRLQAVMLKQAQEMHVPVVLIGPSEFFDGIPPAIRCYRPYHDYALKFTVLEEDGYTFLVDPARNPGAGPVGTEAQLQKLDAIFRRQDVFRLPLAWGDSFATMRNRFTSVARIPDAQTAPVGPGAATTFTWQIPAAASSGTAADFFRFHLDFDPVDRAAYDRDSQCDPPIYNGTEPEFLMTWTNADGSVSAPIQLRGHNGDHLVPLGANPRWLLGSGFSTLNLTLQNPSCARNMTVSDAEFLLLKPL